MPLIVEDSEANDAHLTMMERKPWSQRLNRRLPLRFRDVPPEPLPHVPVVSSDTGEDLISAAPVHTSEDLVIVPRPLINSSIGQRVQSCTATRPNTFGLFRSYNTLGLPSHDPEEHVMIDTLSSINDPSAQPSNDAFYPFPNLNAFRLGDCYWNGGTQKSQSSFQTLLDIVGDPGF